MAGLGTILHKKSGTSDATHLRSPAIWGDCPILDIFTGVRSGVYWFDDFLTSGDEDGADSEYERYIDTSDTIRNLIVDTTAEATGSRGGVLRLAHAATDNNGPVIQLQTATGAVPFMISTTSGANWKTYFEARIRTSSVVDDVNAFAIGLAEVDRAADNGLLEDDTGDIVDSKSFLGFRVKHRNGGTAGQNALLDIVYQDGAQTAPTVVIASAATLVAATWIKVGFLYNPFEVAEKRIKLFINNQEQSTYITAANIAAATFPLGDAMSLVASVKAGTGTAGTFDIDYWGICQLYD